MQTAEESKRRADACHGDTTHFGLAARLAMLGAVLQWQAEAAHLMP